ncbi:ogr/Delta-like zinc finger family protein [Erwinia sp. SLM-02]
MNANYRPDIAAEEFGLPHCSYCKSPAHTKSSRYMSEQVRERDH